MTAIEERVRAAARAEAATMREVRPLRLPPASGEPSGARARRARTWIAPLTAAATVIAFAISLVVIRDIPNGRVVPPASPAPVTGGVPRYYVTLYSPPGHASTTDLLVGDTLTGTKLAVVPPPNGSDFSGVAAAADDRTFVADTTSTTLPVTKTWYLLRIAPGTSTPARLTRLRIPSIVLPGNFTIAGIALSGSGNELAVATAGPAIDEEVLVYSVASGKLLHRWSTNDSQAFGMGSFEEESRALAWIDGDRALAFAAAFVVSTNSNSLPQEMTWRRLDVAARGGDLMADSTVIWSLRVPPSALDSPVSSCLFNAGITTQLISADGKTVVCGTVNLVKGTYRHPVAWRVAWLSFSVRTRAVRTLYAVTVRTAQPPYIFGLWASTSGDTIIGEWGLRTPGFYFESPHVGVISHGTFRQLPTPPDAGTRGPSVTW